MNSPVSTSEITISLSDSWKRWDVSFLLRKFQNSRWLWQLGGRGRCLVTGPSRSCLRYWGRTTCQYQDTRPSSRPSCESLRQCNSGSQQLFPHLYFNPLGSLEMVAGSSSSEVLLPSSSSPSTSYPIFLSTDFGPIRRLKKSIKECWQREILRLTSGPPSWFSQWRPDWLPPPRVWRRPHHESRTCQ